MSGRGTGVTFPCHMLAATRLPHIGGRKKKKERAERKKRHIGGGCRGSRHATVETRRWRCSNFLPHAALRAETASSCPLQHCPFLLHRAASACFLWRLAARLHACHSALHPPLKAWAWCSCCADCPLSWCGDGGRRASTDHRRGALPYHVLAAVCRMPVSLYPAFLPKARTWRAGDLFLAGTGRVGTLALPHALWRSAICTLPLHYAPLHGGQRLLAACALHRASSAAALLPYLALPGAWFG